MAWGHLGSPHVCGVGLECMWSLRPGPLSQPLLLTAGFQAQHPGPLPHLGLRGVHSGLVVCPGGSRALEADSSPLGRESLSPGCPKQTREEGWALDSSSIWPGRRGTKEWRPRLGCWAPGQREGVLVLGCPSQLCPPQALLPPRRDSELRMWGFVYMWTPLPSCLPVALMGPGGACAEVGRPEGRGWEDACGSFYSHVNV